MRSIVSLLLVALAFASPGARAQGAAEAPAHKRIVLLVDEYKAIRNFPIIVAERLGYLAEGGAVVTVMNIRDDIPTVQMLLDGRVDAVMAYYHHNIVNRSEGRNLEAIVTLGVTPGAKVLVANQVRDKYRSAADLKGARIIAGGAGSSKTTVANALVLAGGHGVGDYTRIANESKDKIVAALKSGAADLVVAPTPDGDFYEAQGVATVFADLTTVEGTRKHLGGLLPTATIYMASARVKSDPWIAQHLANAFVRALKYINTHAAEEVAALIPAEISGKDREAYLKLLKAEMPMFANDGRMPAEDAVREWKVLCAFNPRFKSVKVEETYTNAFVDAALATQAQSAAPGAGSPTMAAIRKRGTLLVGNKFGFQTFNYKAGGGVNEGYMADLARALAKRMLGDESKVEFRKTTDETRFEMLAAGDVDVIIDLTPSSEEKARQADFSDEIFRSGSGLLVKKGSPVKGVEDLREGTRVLYVTENHDVEQLKAKAPKATYIGFSNSTEAFAALKAGKGDAFTQVVTHLYRAASQDHDYVLVARFTDKPYFVAVRKGDTAMRDYVNEFLASLKSSGDYDRLFQKWFAPYGGIAAR